MKSEAATGDAAMEAGWDAVGWRLPGQRRPCFGLGGLPTRSAASHPRGALQREVEIVTRFPTVISAPIRD